MYFKGRRNCSVTVLSGPVCSLAVTAVYSKKTEIERDDILMWEWRPLSGTECRAKPDCKGFHALGVI